MIQRDDNMVTRLSPSRHIIFSLLSWPRIFSVSELIFHLVTASRRAAKKQPTLAEVRKWSHIRCSFRRRNRYLSFSTELCLIWKNCVIFIRDGWCDYTRMYPSIAKLAYLFANTIICSGATLNEFQNWVCGDNTIVAWSVSSKIILLLKVKLLLVSMLRQPLAGQRSFFT